MSAAAASPSASDTAPLREIAGFRLDDENQWVARLVCGHGQHVRHLPPWQIRTWTQTPAGRDAMLGTRLPCRKCERGEPPDA
ncbi:DUF3565 domain-containing protein [Pandoraea apista]|uniref:DUF3565 domain-containing protein n=1 Tax=Pandoraea apista TaxID=93218 RepID=A0ABX9ZW44_9BURK|nr:DUF3565 domain-containing protein [Pandoraea apista]AVF40334.1 DUF3565 domain-containing protein [Pandoraea apista]OXS89795.1 GNAT family acetyltransferase [Pandoraea apista]PTE02878.1 DUF3565 domain-containing protein [Pandoraea apista]RRJ29879.1 DUF3565 domain-containing protein [Pandoraea apista]RRJ81204.1 DUF3565 domain-containing protein [Pandoraea apista]